MSRKSSNKGFDIKFEGLNKNSDGSFSAPGHYEPKNKETASTNPRNTVDPRLFEGIDSKNWGSGGRNAVRRKTKRRHAIHRRTHIKHKKRTSLKNRRH